MILRWVIFSSVIFWLVYPRALAAAAVTGRVELTNSSDVAVKKGKNYSGVVLWLEPVNRAASLPPSRHVEMAQVNKSFSPHVVAVPVGGIVDFPNFDPIFHNAFSNFSGQPFDVGLYKPGATRSVTFTHAGIVRVFCNIHAAMSAIIAVVPTTWYAVTETNGVFTISDVPPGEYQLHIFYERALQEFLNSIQRQISVPAGGLILPLISITETGYIPTPHLDKHGKPYPPQSQYGVYAGGHN
jgi:plastocyanin